jgi:molecular chaperone DnaJ
LCYHLDVQDPYEVLGLDRGATTDEIKSAFRRLAQKYHPDRNPGDDSSQQRFKEINAAYQVLGDPDKRARYDRFGASAFGAADGGGAGGFGFVDLGNLDLEGMFGDLLRGFGIKKGDRGDVEKEITISFEEAAFGCEKEIRYDKVEPCSTCGGSGGAAGRPVEKCPTCGGRGRLRVQSGLLPIAMERPCSRCHATGRIVTEPCSVCRGAGVVTAPSTVKVGIPAGSEDGATRTVAHAGNVTRSDHKPGDLELTVRVKPHPFFRRVGDDVTCSVPISIVHAVLGGEVEIPTLEGKGKLRVPPGTQSGHVLRVRGKGIVRRIRSGRGDLLAEVAVAIPTALTARQREIFEELAKELGDDVQTPERRTFLDKLRELFG